MISFCKILMKVKYNAEALSCLFRSLDKAVFVVVKVLPEKVSFQLQQHGISSI